MDNYRLTYEGKTYRFPVKLFENIIDDEVSSYVAEIYTPKFAALDKKYSGLLREGKIPGLYVVERRNLELEALFLAEGWTDIVKKYMGKLVKGAGNLGAAFGKLIGTPLNFVKQTIVGALDAVGIKFNDPKKKKAVENQLVTYVTGVEKVTDASQLPKLQDQLQAQLVAQALLTQEEAKKVATEAAKKVAATAAKQAGGTGTKDTLTKSLKNSRKLTPPAKKWITDNIINKINTTGKITLSESLVLEATPAAAPTTPATPAAPAAPAAKPVTTPAKPASPSSSSATKLSKKPLTLKVAEMLANDKTLKPEEKALVRGFLVAFAKKNATALVLDARFAQLLDGAGIGVKPVDVTATPAAPASPAPAAPTAPAAPAAPAKP